MSGKRLKQLQLQYYSYLDRKARHLARNPKTKLLLSYIHELYTCTNVEKDFETNGFETAYHRPVTSELEFLIARTIYHYLRSQKSNSEWKVYLRRQVSKVSPDVRIDKNGKTVAIIEIKAKVGWMQPVFSKRAIANNITKSNFKIKEFKDQITKYQNTFHINKNQMYVLVPSLKEAHRKGGTLNLDSYLTTFAKNSGLNRGNLILLSKNLDLNLDKKEIDTEYNPTNSFETFIQTLK